MNEYHDSEDINRPLTDEEIADMMTLRDLATNFIPFQLESLGVTVVRLEKILEFICCKDFNEFKFPVSPYPEDKMLLDTHLYLSMEKIYSIERRLNGVCNRLERYIGRKKGESKQHLGNNQKA